MGQLDNVNQTGGDQVKLNLGAIQFHDAHSAPPAVKLGPGLNLNFHSIVGTTNGDAAPVAPAAIAPIAPVRPQPVAPTRLPYAAPAQTYDYSTAAQPPRPGAVVADASTAGSEPRPPHPPDSDSTDEQMGGLLTGVAALGATVIAGNVLRGKLRADEIKRIVDLEQVTKPETLEALKIQTDAVTRVVAEKSREATGIVAKLAEAKPEAFQEITEQMPAKGPGRPPEFLVYHQPKPARALTAEELALPEDKLAALKGNMALTEDELAMSDRAEYLRSLERVLVKDFNIGNTKTVSAFRVRQPNVVGLGKTDFAGFEGLTEPLNKVESLSNTLMDETEIGRIAMHKEVSGEILKGVGMLGGSFLATRGIDHLLYSKPQGFLTTGFDCALPFVVLTNMSPMAKIGIMIGGHELVRGIEYLTNKNKDQ